MAQNKITINKKFFYLIIILFTLTTINFIVFIFIHNFKSRNMTDTTNFSTEQVLKYLEENGYIFEKVTYESDANTIYVTVRNKKNNIDLKKIKNSYIGTWYIFHNQAYNNDYADILEIDKNNDADKKLQYSAYKKWLEKINLDDSQIVAVLNYYDQNNIYKTIDDSKYLD